MAWLSSLAMRWMLPETVAWASAEANYSAPVPLGGPMRALLRSIPGITFVEMP